MKKLVASLLVAFSLWALIPTFLFKRLQKPSVKKGIHLSFDDGPAPLTEELLDLLKSYDVRASFFVLSEQVEKHPEILRRMQLEGHHVGLHGRSHRTHWWMTPMQIKEEIVEEVMLLNALGIRPRYYRPPHGRIHWGTKQVCRDLGLELYGWSHILRDWKKQRSNHLFHKLKRAEGEGHVLLLHDAGRDRAVPGASQCMLRTLRRWIPDYLRRGGKFTELL